MKYKVKDLVICLVGLALSAGLAFLATQAEANDYESPANQQVNESNSSSSNAMTNLQINQNDNTARSRVGDVECSNPSLDAGLAGNRTLGSGSMAYVGVTIPLGTGTCGNAQKQRLYQMKRELHWAEVEQTKKDILFKQRMGDLCGEAKTTGRMKTSPILAQACFDAANATFGEYK